MAKFVFKLGGLLRARERAEQDCQRALAVVAAEHQKLVDEARVVAAQVEAGLNDLREKHLVGPINLAYLSSHRRFSAAMTRKGEQLDLAIAGAVTRVDAARAALVEASKQKRMLEKLREQQLERFNSEVDRKMTADLDEIAMQMSAGEK